jgi:hypothetical protein
MGNLNIFLYACYLILFTILQPKFRKTAYWNPMAIGPVKQVMSMIKECHFNYLL